MPSRRALARAAVPATALARLSAVSGGCPRRSATTAAQSVKTGARLTRIGAGRSAMAAGYRRQAWLQAVPAVLRRKAARWVCARASLRAEMSAAPQLVEALKLGLMISDEIDEHENGRANYE